MTDNILENQERFIAWAGALIFQVAKTCRKTNEEDTQTFSDVMAALMFQTLTDPRPTSEIANNNKKLAAEISKELRDENKLQ